jgi:esterase/lipase superfamily enzyme
MHIEEHSWWSNNLKRDMALKIYGHWGKPFIVFPCSRGHYFA